MEPLYHYTDINTLALILKYKTLRFSRLDKVDDVSETEVFQGYDLAPYLFISCWTGESEESIPMWNLYTKNMAGVRLKLPRSPFLKHKVVSDEANGIHVIGEMYDLIPRDRKVTDEYLFNFPMNEEQDYIRKVEYVVDPISYYKDFVQIETEDGRYSMNMDSIFKLAKYKKKVWAFQDETRYLLIIFPSKSGLYGANKSADTSYKIRDHIFSTIHKHQPNKIEYFDLELGKELDQIEVTLGPQCSEGDAVIVDSLLTRFTSNGKYRRSNLTGKFQSLNR